ncbi:hypothetical protein EVAR_38195_1 [Eumeta japonica]|uniref:Uncharacterized protein n=1 Tax=Eumeta variegata TaxID=151549 RepID=A0A4C1WH26_EUMVA|nr:hypothetical protein EVAR_38195_1 [Eumeta japonica]
MRKNVTLPSDRGRQTKSKNCSEPTARKPFEASAFFRSPESALPRARNFKRWHLNRGRTKGAPRTRDCGRGRRAPYRRARRALSYGNH